MPSVEQLSSASVILTMTDNRTPKSRSALMSRIGPKNTAPEIIVRRLLHKLGYRFRLHPKHLPGIPDIVLPRRKAAIFVHGCYWHGHGCSKGRLAKSNVYYWRVKIEQNKMRDKNQTVRAQICWLACDGDLAMRIDGHRPTCRRSATICGKSAENDRQSRKIELNKIRTSARRL